MQIKVPGYPQIQVTSIDKYTASNVAAKNEITCVADVNSSLNNKYFFLYKANNAVAYVVWFNIDNTGSPPINIPYTEKIEVAISINDSANDVATALASAIDPVSGFNAIVISDDLDTVEVTNTATGAVQTPHDPSIYIADLAINGTGFTFVNTVKGKLAYTPADSTYNTLFYKIIGTIRVAETHFDNGGKYVDYIFKTKPIEVILTPQFIQELIED